MAEWLDIVKPWTWPGHFVGGLEKLGGGSGDRAGDVSAAAQQRDPYVNNLLTALQRQANGDRGSKQLYSAAMLRHGLGRNIAAQQAMAASARPGQTALANRFAAQKASQLGAEMSGQQAMAAIAERQMQEQMQQQAQAQLANYLTTLRSQDINAALGVASFPTGMEKILGMGAGIAGAALMSDRNVKTDIRDGDADADALLEGLKAYSYRYKDERHGAGQQLGVMAQDLESAGLQQAVVETSEGKAVDTAKLSGALAAGLARVHRRVKKLEEAA